MTGQGAKVVGTAARGRRAGKGGQYPLSARLALLHVLRVAVACSWQGRKVTSGYGTSRAGEGIRAVGESWTGSDEIFVLLVVYAWAGPVSGRRAAVRLLDGLVVRAGVRNLRRFRDGWCSA